MSEHLIELRRIVKRYGTGEAASTPSAVLI